MLFRSQISSQFDPPAFTAPLSSGIELCPSRLAAHDVPTILLPTTLGRLLLEAHGGGATLGNGKNARTVAGQPTTSDRGREASVEKKERCVICDVWPGKSSHEAFVSYISGFSVALCREGRAWCVAARPKYCPKTLRRMDVTFSVWLLSEDLEPDFSLVTLLPEAEGKEREGAYCILMTKLSAVFQRRLPVQQDIDMGILGSMKRRERNWKKRGRVFTAFQ